MIVAHLQLLIGFILYFTSAKVIFSANTMSETLTRFYAVEHPFFMIVAIALITLGYIKAKKSQADRYKFKKTGIYFLIALVFLLARFPWQYLTVIGAGWFL
jgi:hypothetical protein